MSYRDIHLPNGVWSYKVGRSYTVIRDPHGSRRSVDTHLVSGGHYDEDRDQQTPVTPEKVKRFILSGGLADARSAKADGATKSAAEDKV